MHEQDAAVGEQLVDDAQLPRAADEGGAVAMGDSGGEGAHRPNRVRETAPDTDLRLNRY